MTTTDSGPVAPSVARMFEYWLGGSNYEPVDADLARAFEQVFPPARDAYRALRRCTQVAVSRMHDLGIRRYLVLGAGIPASGNVHEFAPFSEVLYSDIDPAAVELGGRLTADLDGVDYVWADAARPLESLAVSAFLEASVRPVGILYTGVTPFIPDEALAEGVRALHDASLDGSMLFLDFDAPGFGDFPVAVQAIRASAPHYEWRTRAQCERIFGPWALGPYGILAADAWTEDPGVRSETQEPFTYVGYARHDHPTG